MWRRCRQSITAPAVLFGEEESMRNNQRFGITEDGQVFEINGHLRRLGSLAHLMTAGTATAQAVQEWWRGQVESDGPLSIIDVVELDKGRRQYLVRGLGTEPISELPERPHELAA
jgi:hypothetical protein